MGHSTGGTPPFSYAWTVTSDPAGVAPTPSASTDVAPTFTLEAPPAGTAFYTLNVEMRVTDSGSPPTVVTEARDVLVNSSSLPPAGSTTVTQATRPLDSVANPTERPGSECLLCGDVDRLIPCSDLDLLLAMTTRCSDTKPYCQNVLRVEVDPSDPSLLTANEYRRCVDGATANDTWYQQTRLRPVCAPELNGEKTPGIFCFYACYGDGCNVTTYLTGPEDSSANDFPRAPCSASTRITS